MTLFFFNYYKVLATETYATSLFSFQRTNPIVNNKSVYRKACKVQNVKLYCRSV